MSAADPLSNPSDERLVEIFKGLKTVAVVGLSAKPDRASHGIARFLKGQGFDVVGVNPVLKEPVLDLPLYAELKDVPGPVDIVNVFRRSDTVLSIAEAAVGRGDRCVWMQEEVVNAEAAELARTAGLDVIQDRCIYKEWLRLMNG